jgi:hypothetical protein
MNTTLEERPWMRSFGALMTLHIESAPINERIEQEFGRIESEDRDA